MTVEQKPEFNRFVDSSIPITWTWRWQQFKFVLPIWCFIWACYLEMGITAAWLRDKLNLVFIADVVGGLFIFTVMMWVLIEILVRLRQRSKRILRIKDKQLVISPAKNNVVSWKRIARIQFEPIPELPNSQKLTIFLRDIKKRNQTEQPFWMMVLEQSSQVTELVNCLEAKRKETSFGFEIVSLKEPANTIQGKLFSFAGMSFAMAGAYFLLHGIPLLGVALEKHHDHSGSDVKLGAHATAVIKHFMQEHFSSIQELHNFTLHLSISLIVVGLLFYFGGLKLMNRQPKNSSTQI